MPTSIPRQLHELVRSVSRLFALQPSRPCEVSSQLSRLLETTQQRVTSLSRASSSFNSSVDSTP